ncbi:MAG: adenylate/guanylate cyclase domain-containing protein [Acidimicrobiia bacterium]
MIWNEPVRGAVPDRSFLSLAGMDRARAMLRLEVPAPPLSRLTGTATTQLGAGSATLTTPATPWLNRGDGTLDVTILLQSALTQATLTSAPPGSEVVPATLSIHHLRPCTIEARSLVARARVLNTGPRYTLTEVLVEDALGRAVAHAAGSFLIQPAEPPPDPWHPPACGDEPAYATPDPYLRDLDYDDVLARAFNKGEVLGVFKHFFAGDLPTVPIFDLLGMRITDAAEGRGTMTVTATDWLRDISPSTMSYGVLAFAAHAVTTGAVATMCPAEHRVGILEFNTSFLKPVATDGRELVARAVVANDGLALLVSSGELLDADGTVAAVARVTALFIKRRPRPGATPAAERLLATVMFTDLVDSTRRAEELGDAAWAELLAGHHDAVRRQLETWKGKEVKTTGDGFLATFDSPARALQCARGIRDAVRHLGLQVRAGVHTGECEVSRDDVTGIAVHVAARVMGTAGPGEIAVSSLVKDLVAGSGLRFHDLGRHQLKGIEGEWQLHALTD